MKSKNHENKLSTRRYLANLQGEIDSAALYQGLAEIEQRPDVSGTYLRLAEIEHHHAEFWRKRLLALGREIPEMHSRWRTHALVWLARRFGAGLILPIPTSL